MRYDDTIACPECGKETSESVPFVYKTLCSKNAGKNLFEQAPIEIKTPELTEQQRHRLIHKLTPPAAPKRSLPAGAIAIMAFFMSWLVTGALLIVRIGYTTYFLITIGFVITVGYPFYSILRMVIKDFRRAVYRYSKIKAAWKKQFFCHTCHHIFAPKENKT